MNKWLAGATVTAALAGLALSGRTPQGNAAFPGRNGRIAFDVYRGAGNQEISTMNPDGSGLAPLTGDSGHTNAVAVWSPDGSQLAFMSNRDGNQEIYVMNADGSDQTRLTNNDVPDGDPSWSPDGSKISFVSSRNGSADVYVMNADGSGETRITSGQAEDIHYPSWSPDGTKFAFTRGNLISVVNADGTGPVQLTHDGASYWPKWSPDGSMIVFEMLPGGEADEEIFVINADGTGLTRLTDTDANEYTPAWSPDGTRIAFSGELPDGTTQIYAMDAGGGDATQLTEEPTPAFAASPDWQPIRGAKGDVDCNGAGNAVDALKILRDVAGLPVSQNEPCPDIGAPMPEKWGDIDCGGGVDAVDALLVLRNVAGLSVSLPQNCAGIGS